MKESASAAALSMEEIVALPAVVKVSVAARVADMSGREMRKLLGYGTIKGFKVGSHWRVNTRSLLEYCGLV